MTKMNKRGAETTIGTIVVLILAIIVLVVVAVGFSIGWNNLWARLNVFTPAALSIDAVVGKCGSLCLANQPYEYCCKTREVEISEDNPIKKSCDKLESENNLPIECETINCENVKCEEIK